jgi:outer membrane protein insertion porin family
MRRLACALLLLTGLVVCPPSRAQTEAPVVREVEIRFVGPETVHRAVVSANIQTAAGKPLSRENIEQDVRNLIATGYFFDVRVLEETVSGGVKVIFQVQGKATIKEFVIEGNKHLKVERLQRELTQKAGDVFSEYKLHQDIQKIVEIYQKAGFADARVDRDVSVDKDTGKAVVRLKIAEGPRVFIQRIVFSGNNAFPPGRLLKLMKVKRRWWGSWLSGGGVMRNEEFDEDLQTLREHYRSHGYIDMEIRETRVERSGSQWIVVHIDLFEGSQYKVGDVRMEGVTLFPAEDVQRRLRMTAGKLFTPDGLDKDRTAVLDYYGARGYLDTGVRVSKTPNVETGRIDLMYRVQEGELTYVEKVEIHGNTKTKDKVIRRELAVRPGDIYDTVRVERSAERLRNLNYFSKVDTTPQATPVPNRRDLVVTVEEQNTGSLNFGAGFSTIDNLLGFVELTQGNFDLFNPPVFQGGGQKLRLRLQGGAERQDVILSFVEPWFLDQKLSLGVDLFHHQSSFLSSLFDEQRTGGDVRLEKALNEFMRVGVEYGLQNITLDVLPAASRELQAEDGSNLRSSLQAQWVYDTRDSVFLTTRGNRTEFSAELVGGPLGGDVSVYKLNAKTAFYFPFFNRHVLQLLGAAGVVDAYGDTRGRGPVVTETVISGGVTNTFDVKVNDVPIYDRYFLGGANTMRGFDYRAVGPKDIDGEPVGGNTYANATVEYSFPIVERVRAAVFFDIGNVWRDAYDFDFGDLKSDVGIGVRLNLPIGPLRLDYGYPIQTDDQTGRNGRIQFSVGYQF